MTRVGVLISGRGTNLQALIDARSRGELGGDIVAVVSNVEGAAGLERARGAGIETFVVPHAGLGRAEHEGKVVERLRSRGVELVCLAGYMRVLTAVLLGAFPGRVLNVHPSLLPAFAGREAQRQAVEHGVKVSGATIHFVDASLDGGPILLQEAVPVEPDDTAESLSARILLAEHRLYPRAVRTVLEGRYRLEGRRVRLLEG